MASAMDKAQDTENTAEQNTGEYASDKTGEYDDYAIDKMNEVADTTTGNAGEKGKEETNAAAGTMAQLKESATTALMKARDVLTGKAEEVDEKALGGGDITTEKYGESEFKAREKMGEMKLNEEGVYDEAMQRAAADRETAADRGIAARQNIYGAAGSLTQSIKEKLTYPTDIVHEARASREYGGPKRAPKETLMEDVEGGPSGPAAMPTVRTSD